MGERRSTVHGYNIPLVIISLAISIGSALLSLHLCFRYRKAKPSNKWRLLAASSFIMGSGIWSMHFIGMLAMQANAPLSYDATLVALSAAAAIGASGLAFRLLHDLNRAKYIAASFSLAGGIVSMHYLGMAAIVMPFRVLYRSDLVVLSVVIAVAFSLLSIYMFYQACQRAERFTTGKLLASATVLGAAVAAMHYSGVSAVRCSPLAIIPFQASTAAHRHIIEEADLITVLVYACMLTGACLSLYAFLERKLALVEEPGAAAAGKHSADSSPQLGMATQEERLLRSEKLEIVGSLAAGIAHEIRNPLTTVKGMMQYGRNKEMKPTYFDVILDEIEHIETIVADFMLLSVPSEVGLNYFNPVPLIVEAIDGAAAFKNAHMQLDNELDGSASQALPVLYGDSTKLKRVFSRIFVEIMEIHCGKNSPCARIAQKDQERLLIKINFYASEGTMNWVHQLGTLYYRTKDRGTGVEWMVIYHILVEHGGEIYVETHGDDAILYIELPVKWHSNGLTENMEP